MQTTNTATKKPTEHLLKHTVSLLTVLLDILDENNAPKDTDYKKLVICIAKAIRELLFDVPLVVNSDTDIASLRKEIEAWVTDGDRSGQDEYLIKIKIWATHVIAILTYGPVTDTSTARILAKELRVYLAERALSVYGSQYNNRLLAMAQHLHKMIMPLVPAYIAARQHDNSRPVIEYLEQSLSVLEHGNLDVAVLDAAVVMLNADISFLSGCSRPRQHQQYQQPQQPNYDYWLDQAPADTYNTWQPHQPSVSAAQPIRRADPSPDELDASMRPAASKDDVKDIAEKLGALEKRLADMEATVSSTSESLTSYAKQTGEINSRLESVERDCKYIKVPIGS